MCVETEHQPLQDHPAAFKCSIRDHEFLPTRWMLQQESSFWVRLDGIPLLSSPCPHGSCVCVLGSRFLPDVFRRTTFLLSGHDPPFVRCSRGRWKGIKAPHFVLTGRGLGVCRNGTPAVARSPRGTQKSTDASTKNSRSSRRQQRVQRHRTLSLHRLLFSVPAWLGNYWFWGGH